MRSAAARRRRFRIVITTVVVSLLAAVALIDVKVIAFPELTPPGRADAVLVLGPPTVQRLVRAQGLIDDGLADELVISAPSGAAQDDEHTLLRNLCLGRSATPATCITPDPFTTQGEARLARDLLNERGWSSIIVVTSVTHVSRAQMLFERCVSEDGRIQFTSDERDYDARRWVEELVYQTGAWGKALLTTDC
jgi:uncharacterized SAM-binding protein YcdF (DUF218 family)